MPRAPPVMMMTWLSGPDVVAMIPRILPAAVAMETRRLSARAPPRNRNQVPFDEAYRTSSRCRLHTRAQLRRRAVRRGRRREARGGARRDGRGVAERPSRSLSRRVRVDEGLLRDARELGGKLRAGAQRDQGIGAGGRAR